MNFEIFTSLLISVIMFLINAVPLLAFGAFFDRTQELVVRLFGFILGAIALSRRYSSASPFFHFVKRIFHLGR